MAFSKNKLLSLLSNTLFPTNCLVCGRAGTYICTSCEHKLPRNSQTVSDWATARYNYRNVHVKKILFRLKYHHSPQIGTVLGRYAAQDIKGVIPASNRDVQIILIPIPLSYTRQKQRGYNQAQKIAEGIQLGLEGYKIKAHILPLLTRGKETEKLHSSESREERFEELRDAFSVDTELLHPLAGSPLGEPALLVLVDDITTSGATFFDARRALVEVGFDSKQISSYALAH